MALFDPGPVAFTEHVPRCMTPNLDGLSYPRPGEVGFQDIERLEAEPGIDHHGCAIREVCGEGEDRQIAGLAELPVVLAVTGSQMSEEGLLDRVEGQQRPAPGVRYGSRHGALARGGKAVDENRPFHEFRARFVNALRPAPITPARSPSAAGSTGHWYQGAKAGKLASA